MPINTKSKIKQERLGVTLVKYQEALNWLETKGFNVKSSRLAKYAQNYQKLLDNWLEETFREKIENKSYSSSVYEIHEIIEIHKRLVEFDCKEVNESLKKVLSGVELYEEDGLKTKPSSARDFSFELYMASYFKRAGYNLSFNTIADFNASDSKDSFFVECKRPAKEETLGKNIEKALKQSVKRFVSDSKFIQKGVAAIDISHLLNPNHEFYVVKDLNETSEYLKVADEVYSPIIKENFDKYGENCIAVILNWRLPLLHIPNQQLGLYNRVFSVPIFNPNSTSEEAFQRMSNKLKSSVGV
ncbi:MAG: hypothetical protein HRT50_16055 [Colwellia sp.]|uniref:hypothetical protein n=1 Tax=Colwellia sp. TaxID=56799 RepID=UPI001DA9EDEF|nr:hypothetical protein [Colwellia sp.]NQY50580.1 hypothetical protein [Colwellia sp.]